MILKDLAIQTYWAFIIEIFRRFGLGGNEKTVEHRSISSYIYISIFGLVIWPVLFDQFQIHFGNVFRWSFPRPAFVYNY